MKQNKENGYTLSRYLIDHYTRSSLNGFAAGSINRATERRKDGSWIDARLRDPKTLYVPVWQLKNLLTSETDPRLIALPGHEIAELLPTAESITLLGERDGSALFCVDISSEGDGVARRFAHLGEFHDLRKVSALVDRQEGSLLAYARAVAYWHRRHRFCGECGTPTQSTEGGHIRICTNETCKAQHFPRTDPAIIVLVASGDCCLLGRQSFWPKRMFSTIAGFVEPGETLEGAVIREVREETGIRVKEVHYHSSQPWPFPCSIMLGFTALAAREDIHLNDNELESARWFSREELRSMLKSGEVRLPSPISIAYRLIEDWFDIPETGELRRILNSPR